MCNNRIEDICGQLERYGWIADSVLDVLDVIVDINDDICNDRDLDLIKKEIEKAKILLDKIVD